MAYPSDKATRDLLTSITGVRLPNHPPTTLWDLTISPPPSSVITSITPHNPKNTANHSASGHHGYSGALLTPPLCHPHIHLDKPFLLSTPPHSSLPPPTAGTFAEAMSLTRQAKASFTRPDLLRRGRRLLRESLRAGVTACRAFVEVDPGVGMLCLDVGLELKREWEGKGVDVQVCAFAQEGMFGAGKGDSGIAGGGGGEDADVDDDGVQEMKSLMEEAAGREGVDVVGSAPYVEATEEKAKRNVEWMIDLAGRHCKHVDFHLDYYLERERAPLVWEVVKLLRKSGWGRCGMDPGIAEKQKTVALGHCSRLTLFQKAEWQALRRAIDEDLKVAFVGLPTSDLFMMGRPAPSPSQGSEDSNEVEAGHGGGERVRGTLQIPQMISEYGFQAAIGVNNVGNAFTPWGSCDPLGVASLGIGVYHAGTSREWELLFQCVSGRAREVIGLEDVNETQSRQPACRTEILVGDRADFVIWGGSGQEREIVIGEMGDEEVEDGGISVTRKTVQELVCDPPELRERIVVKGGVVVSRGDSFAGISL